MLCSVKFRFRSRMIPLDADSPPRPNLPEDWQEDEYEFKFESPNGVQGPAVGVTSVASATTRKVVVVAPRETINTDVSTDWPTFVLGFFPSQSHKIGGTLILTEIDEGEGGQTNLTGQINPPAYTFYIEGEEFAYVGKWRGLRRLWWFPWI